MTIEAIKTRIYDRVGIPTTLDRINLFDKHGNYFEIVLRNDSRINICVNDLTKIVSFQELHKILYEGIK